MSRIPDDLMQRFHNANTAFAEARSKLKNLEEMDTKQRAEAAASLRSAEKVVEDLEKEISNFLNKSSHGASR